MPFASPKLIEAGSRLLVEEEADIVIARSDEGYEPLHAIYRRETCLPAIEAAIDADQWKVIAWFPQVKVRVLTPDEINRYDTLGLAFWNVNTPEEFAEAERISLSLPGKGQGCYGLSLVTLLRSFVPPLHSLVTRLRNLLSLLRNLVTRLRS